MDIKRIRSAMQEDGAASGTSATPGPGAIGGGIAPFKAKMGTWKRKDEEIDPQTPGVVQSTQHASDAQIINPMHETTHEEVNLFDEERIAFSEMPLKPFGGLQMGDFEIGINSLFDQIAKVVEYNISNTTDPTNTNVQSLKNKYATLKKQESQKIERVIWALDSGNVYAKEKEINLSDIFQVICLMQAYNDNDGDPKSYAMAQCERLLEIAKGDALELAAHLYKTLVPKIVPSKATLMSMADETIDSINKEQWGEAIVWNKLRKTVENMNIQDDDNDFDSELPPVEPEVEPEAVAESLTTSSNGDPANQITPMGNNEVPSQDGRISKPILPLQGTNAIHEEEAPNEIQSLSLGDISVQGYFATENNKPTLIRYKVMKGGVPMPVDPKKEQSENIGHTKEQVLKKLSLLPQKVQFIKKFLKYNKENENTLKTKQQEKMG